MTSCNDAESAAPTALARLIRDAGQAPGPRAAQRYRRALAARRAHTRYEARIPAPHCDQRRDIVGCLRKPRAWLDAHLRRGGPDVRLTDLSDPDLVQIRTIAKYHGYSVEIVSERLPSLADIAQQTNIDTT